MMEKEINDPIERMPKWRSSDTIWMLSLYGTAIGAGVLFLPINAGAGGLIPLLVLAVLAFPMTFLAHRALCRFVLCGNAADITVVVEQQFGKHVGYFITLLYFFAIYPILLVYSVSLTNTVESFFQYQLHIQPLPRSIIALLLIVFLMGIVQFGEQLIVKVMSTLVYPFVAILMIIALFLIPQWTGEIFHHVSFSGAASSGGTGLILTLWLTIPVAVFSFNHSPIISSLAVAKHKEYGQFAEKKCSKIIEYSNIMMVVTVMFFVFSCALCLTPANLQEAKVENVSILSYLANHFNTPFLKWVAPIVAFVAICKSFLGHYLGAREGIHGVVIKTLNFAGIGVKSNRLLQNGSSIFILLTAWIVATYNPSVLGMIESIGGPVLAIILFLMPMYAIHTVPVLAKYKGKPSNIFVTIMGCIAVSAAIYRFFV
ncbi:aromatic amino acid transport family protein [Commensalibacter oyaizuii]|uniref:Aromatic amino acid transport family protein n=1 Tax=Commensalibacter oyaizuii TaxID=3043873 RepID=A0ABT6Q1F2_9PROT|nr:aromatic amino acid transport family protein [Commensalibacter sp. TBRC 16381]MDI2090314.1 aromatic amino acid transport family protein [Commensalibacter sp. TBRC 16381]